MVGFKLKSCLNSIGYIGLKDKETYKSGKPIYRKLIINHIKRHVIPLDNNEYISDNKVEFVNLSILDIINGTSTKR
jgi:hypothetical protein